MSPFQLSFSALCTGIAMVAFTSTIKLSNRNELLTSDVPHRFALHIFTLHIQDNEFRHWTLRGLLSALGKGIS